jgi:predicted CopG family antitoxin
MAGKNIKIDLEAYRLLAARKRKGESFSDVIKRVLRQRSTARSLLEAVENVKLSEEALDKLQEIVESRKESLIDPPALDGDR